MKNLLAGAQNVLISLPTDLTIDKLAAGLALLLSLEQSGKKAEIVTDGIVRVEHSNLFGVGKIKNQLSEGSGGDFIIILGGVASPDGTVPAAEKVDYFPSGNDLNLVFRVKPGHKFEPTKITTRYDSGGFDLIFVIGASNLESLGSIYANNQSVFSGPNLVSINNQPASSQFASNNIIDPNASCLSEMIAHIIPPLGLPFEGDIATNVLTGIFTTTANLQDPKAQADTYEAVAQAVRAGGQKLGTSGVSVVTPVQPIQQFTPPPQPPVQEPVSPFAQFNQAIGLQENYTIPPVVSGNPEVKPEAQPQYQPSSEEAPRGEAATTETPEADWLTPKIFKGSSIG